MNKIKFFAVISFVLITFTGCPYDEPDDTPEAPEYVTAEKQKDDNNTIKIIWSYSKNADAFEVFRKKDGGEFQFIATVYPYSDSGNSYIDKSYLENGTYIFGVRTLNYDGDKSEITPSAPVTIP